MKKILILLCGLPASGKSTYAKKLNYLHINFDDFWKELNNSDIEKLKETQDRFFNLIKVLISENYSIDDEFVEKYAKEFDMNEEVLLVEDNFYFSSMRDRFYKCFRENEIIFGKLFFKASLKECLQRNVSRGCSVQKKSIKRISERMEYDEDDISLIIDTENTKIEENLTKINSFILKLVPLKKQVEKDMNEVIKSTEENLKSKIHQFDIALRRKTSEIIKNYKGDKKTFSRKIGKLRKEILKKFKENTNNNLLAIFESQIKTITK